MVLLALLCLPAAVVAALIRLDSRGAPLITQPRVGKNGRIFRMYKFRTMCEDAHARIAELTAFNEQAGPIFKMRNDPRMTRVGRWLRKLSVDEVPQLINVVRGDMSLVGPRPPLPHEVQNYSRHQLRRLLTRPGLTGLWQVSGRSTLPFDEMVALDISYIEDWTLMRDLVILLKTLPAVISTRGAY
ncbi:MAG: sugar transferase [Dehalococcoidia bacterium]|nr:sugar transferase [Dehalococcoidia bacterium]